MMIILWNFNFICLYERYLQGGYYNYYYLISEVSNYQYSCIISNSRSLLVEKDFIIDKTFRANTIYSLSGIS